MHSRRSASHAARRSRRPPPTSTTSITSRSVGRSSSRERSCPGSRLPAGRILFVNSLVPAGGRERRRALRRDEAGRAHLRRRAAPRGQRRRHPRRQRCHPGEPIRRCRSGCTSTSSATTTPIVCSVRTTSSASSWPCSRSGRAASSPTSVSARSSSSERPPVRILLTGHHGYIGSVARPMLEAAGHDVVGLDTFYYRGCDFGADAPAGAEIDARRPRPSRPRQLDGFDAVVHLAALSNDPLGDLRDRWTYAINLDGTSPSRGLRRPPASSASCSRPRARCTAPRARTTFSTRRRRSAHSRRTPSRRFARRRRCTSLPTTPSRRSTCGMPPPTACRRGFVSTSSSTTSRRGRTRPGRSACSPTARRGVRSSTSRHRACDAGDARGAARSSFTTRRSTSAPMSRTCGSATSRRRCTSSSTARSR